MPEDLAPRRKARRRLVTVFGGTGFLGRRIVRHLLDDGFEVRAASRRPERTTSIVEPNATGLMSIRADVQNEAEVVAALAGSHAVVNCVSLYVERGQNTFDALHVEAAARLSRLAREAGVDRLAHISGIGADPNSSSRYISARGRGEQVVQAAFPNAILIRPAVMFGPDDAFLTTLVKLVRMLPVYPMFGRGETKMQPVYVEDVAKAVTRLMANIGAARQPCHELGGLQIFTYEELLRTIARHIGARTRFMPMPFVLWHALAWVSEHVPGAPLTRNQIALMRRAIFPACQSLVSSRRRSRPCCPKSGAGPRGLNPRGALSSCPALPRSSPGSDMTMRIIRETAKKLGVDVPVTILSRADEVIE